MEKLMYFILPGCPYCGRATKYIAELVNENPEYAKLPIQTVDETKEKALSDSYDYYLVPSLFCGSKKLFEGAVNKSDVKAAFDYALNLQLSRS